MKTSVCLIGVGVVVSSVTAQKVLPLSFSRAGPEHKSLRKRAGTHSQELNNNLTGGGYYAEVALGTPPQPVTLILDTGSSDVWVLDSGADLCGSSRLQSMYGNCIATYDPAESSTYQLVDRGAFSIQYLDTSGAEGDYIKDTFHVADTQIKALQVGLAESSTINSGLLGIGFKANVAADVPYDNIIDLFVDQDLIASHAYSLYLDDLFAETGTVLFGGIDTEKFIGQLKEVDIQPDFYGNYTSFSVELDSLTVSPDGDSEGSNLLPETIPVILDSGTTLTYLPLPIASRIYDAFGAVDDTQDPQGTGLVYVDCKLLTSKKDMTVDFQFGGKNGPLVKVPIDELVLNNVKGYMNIGLQPPSLPFRDVCSFGIQSLQDVYLLGDTFLRSAYVVYDLTNKKIALAQANLNSTDSNIMEITASGGIPLVKGVSAQGSHGPNGSNSGSGSSGNGNTGDDSSSDDEGSVAPRLAVALSWEATAVMFIATSFSLLGTGLFAF